MFSRQVCGERCVRGKPELTLRSGFDLNGTGEGMLFLVVGCE